MTQEKNLSLGQKQPCQTLVLIITPRSGVGGEFSKHTVGWGCNSVRKLLCYILKPRHHRLFPDQAHNTFPGMLCLQGQLPWHSPPWTGWIYSCGKPWIAWPCQRNQRALHNPRVFLLRKELKFRTFKCLAKQSFPPNPTSCTVTNDATAKGCGAPWGPSPPWEEQTEQSWAGFLQRIPSQTRSFPLGAYFQLPQAQQWSLPALDITCSGYEWLLSSFCSPLSLGDAAVGEGKEVLLLLEENYFKLYQGSST